MAIAAGWRWYTQRGSTLVCVCACQLADSVVIATKDGTSGNVKVVLFVKLSAGQVGAASGFSNA